MKRIPVCLLLLGLLPGCGPDGVANRALEAVGLREPALDPQKSPRQVRLRLHAAPRLNLDAQGRPLALVTRIYSLRQRAAFEAAPYSAFLTPDGDHAAFGADLVGVREMIVAPGQRYEAIENVPREAAYIGVVALFHTPAPRRWRLAFPSIAAEKAGLTVGLQACALSVGAGARPRGGAAKTPGSARCQ